VVLVPELPPDVRGPDDAGVTGAALRQHHGEATLTAIQADLDARRPLGTQCAVKWARYKTVTVKAKVQTHRSADRVAVESRVRARLYRYIDPLPHPDDESGGWRFGKALQTSTLYYLIQSEPGVAYVSSLAFLLDEVPSTATALAADAFQPRTWYAGSGDTLYRSMKDGDGWEAIGRFPGEQIESVVAHPSRPGLIAVAARLPARPGSSRIYRSLDCGETWPSWDRSLPTATDLAWMLRDGAPLLLISTEQGLYELALDDRAQPLPVTVDGADANLPLHAVATAVDARGTWIAAVAAQKRRGIYLSDKGGGRGGTFQPFGLDGKDVRRLELQQDGVRTRLWAGQFADNPEDPGRGASMRDLTSAEDWKEMSGNWDGGSCFALAFDGTMVYAATHHLGVLTLDASKPDAKWARPDLGCGLPQRGEKRLFQPVVALAAGKGLVLAGGSKGVFRRKGDGLYENCSGAEVRPDSLPLPDTWLFCSGQHQIEVVSE
jgi:hypothetical protein